MAFLHPFGGGHGTPNLESEFRLNPPLAVCAASTCCSVKNFLGFHINPQDARRPYPKQATLSLNTQTKSSCGCPDARCPSPRSVCQAAALSKGHVVGPHRKLRCLQYQPQTGLTSSTARVVRRLLCVRPFLPQLHSLQKGCPFVPRHTKA
jgi:hypothetical protein